MFSFDLFDLIVIGVAVAMMPLLVDLINTLAPNHFGRIAQESIGFFLVIIITCLITSALVLWATVFLPFHMEYFKLSSIPHGVFHITIALWLLFHCYYHYFFAIYTGPGHPPKPRRQKKQQNKNNEKNISNNNNNDNDNSASSSTENNNTEQVEEKNKEENKKEDNNKTEYKENNKENNKESNDNNDNKTKEKFCNICKAPKPPRAHHCKVCRTCSLQMDHHCPFLGNCVGQNNQRHFIIFLIFLLLGDLYATFLSTAPFLACVWRPKTKYDPIMEGLCMLTGKYKYILACTSLVTIPISILLLWQLFAVYTNVTTIEAMKKAWSTPFLKWPQVYWQDFKKGKWSNFSSLKGKQVGVFIL